MKVSNLDLPERIREDYIDSGITELNPPQEKAVDAGLLDGRDLIVASPTASGKTFIAELAMVEKAVKEGKTAVYVVPLKALASEKYGDFSDRYEDLNVKISVGNRDEAGGHLENADVVIVTSEKLDSMLRHNPSWIHDIGLVVIDEIHLLTSKNRGPTLEVTLTKLRDMLEFQLLGLSATISNSFELADWLKAELVESDYRPVELRHGIHQGNEIEYFSGDEEIEDSEEDEEELSGWQTGKEVKDEDTGSGSDVRKVDYGEDKPTEDILRDTLEIGKQVINFCNSRKGAEKESDRAAKITEENLSREEKKKLREYADEILNELGSPTSQCERLAKNVSKGAAFHHAGILSGQRSIVEEAFKEGLIKSVSATPTLCLSGDTEVWTDGGHQKVEDLSSSEEVLTLLENDYIEGVKPEKVVENLNDSKLIEIESVCGRSIKVTPDHEVPVKRNGERLFLPAEEVEESDKIATVGRIPVDDLSKPSIDEVLDENQLPIENRDLKRRDFFFIGLMLGDGHSGAETRENSVKYKGSADFANSNKDLLNKVQDYCSSLGLNPRFREASTTDHIVISKHKWFREFLCRSGVEKGEDKHIHKKLVYSDRDKVRELLKGLFDADGWINSGKCIGISNISEQLIKDVQKALLRFGIVSRVRKRPGEKTRFEDRENFETKELFELTIKQSKSIRKFAEKVGFTVDYKEESLENLVDENTTIQSKKCAECDYRIKRTLFSGRTEEQKKWGEQKRRVINFLGANGETGSNELEAKLGFLPRKDERRLNAHYKLIQKRRIGEKSPTEWFWSLNEIGEWIHQNIVEENREISYFLSRKKCPICGTELETQFRGNHRADDFEKDIFWDKVRTVEEKQKEEKVYDVVLPETPENQHLFAANGFLVHNSAGINMPAYRVVNRDLKRYTGQGMEYIPVLEYEQQCGRAGRPKYDDTGEAISIAKNPGMKEEIRERYILGEPERIQSKLNVEPVLRMHTLALVASNFCNSMDDLQEFYRKTFYAHQFGDIQQVAENIRDVVGSLRDYEFIEEDELRATKIGKKVSDLYIDPDSAHYMLESLEKAEGSETRPISYLYMLAMTSEMAPRLRVKDKEWSDYQAALQDAEIYLLDSLPKEWEPGYEQSLEGMKTAMMMQSWIQEMDEERIMQEFGTAPGGIRAKMQNADWLLYGAKELLRMKDPDFSETDRDLEKLRVRMKHGIKEELLDLVQYDQIGRVRARTLSDHGIETQSQIREVGFEKLKKLIGKKTAKKLKKQVGQENIFDRENITDWYD